MREEEEMRLAESLIRREEQNNRRARRYIHMARTYIRAAKQITALNILLTALLLCFWVYRFIVCG